MPVSQRQLVNYLGNFKVSELKDLSKYFNNRLTRQSGGGACTKQELIWQLVGGSAQRERFVIYNPSVAHAHATADAVPLASGSPPKGTEYDDLDFTVRAPTRSKVRGAAVREAAAKKRADKLIAKPSQQLNSGKMQHRDQRNDLTAFHVVEDEKTAKDKLRETNIAKRLRERVDLNELQKLQEQQYEHQMSDLETKYNDHAKLAASTEFKEPIHIINRDRIHSQMNALSETRRRQRGPQPTL